MSQSVKNIRDAPYPALSNQCGFPKPNHKHYNITSNLEITISHNIEVSFQEFITAINYKTFSNVLKTQDNIRISCALQ